VAGSAEAVEATAPAAADAPLQIAQAGDAGKAVYDKVCVVCHSTGAGGAPKVGDKAAWADRIAQGQATLDEHAIKGYQGKSGMMPPKGGRADLSDDDVKAAVSYMAGASQ
jgi:cytochrome c5